MKGSNSDGTKYQSPEQMWDLELNPSLKEIKQALTGNANTIGTEETWYKGSLSYWESQPATIDGVLGGYGRVHETETGTSQKMLADFADFISGHKAAIDLGAGIG